MASHLNGLNAFYIVRVNHDTVNFTIQDTTGFELQ